MRYWWVLAFVVALGFSSTAYANDSQISQQINELDCALTGTSNGSGTVVSPGCPVQRPTVESVSPNNGRPVLRGLFDAAFGPNLRVRVAGVWYRRGVAPELSIQGNRWTLDLRGLSTALQPGEYEVRVEHRLANSDVVVDATNDELIIPEIQVVVPTVDETEWVGGAPVITGTYDEAQTTRLRVNVDGRWYVLGEDSELTARDGGWRLDLRQLSPQLEAGTYDVTVEATFRDGSVLTDDSTEELEILPVSVGMIITHPLANTGSNIFVAFVAAGLLMLAGGASLAYGYYQKRQTNSTIPSDHNRVK